MRAIKIDATNRTITEVETDGKLESIYALIGCSIIEAGGRFTNGDCLFVDEEGLLGLDEEAGLMGVHGFAVRYNGEVMEHPFQEFLAGNGLIVGEGSDGESAGASSALEQIAALVRFHTV